MPSTSQRPQFHLSAQRDVDSSSLLGKIQAFPTFPVFRWSWTEKTTSKSWSHRRRELWWMWTTVVVENRLKMEWVSSKRFTWRRMRRAGRERVRRRAGVEEELGGVRPAVPGDLWYGSVPDVMELR
ncbi:hypothetical protein MRB53_028073 [Persea americana]|uniref:Uncharacterized protein n=1 Tax=Persea americana TaxID=3435 RepID=A0ACC2KF08_PERAE|nr:hypothetical protein MRB53_028073 [Persea americana]